MIRPYLVDGEDNRVAHRDVAHAQSLGQTLKNDVSLDVGSMDLDNAVHLPADKSHAVKNEDTALKVEANTEKPKKEVKGTGGLGWLLGALTLVLLL